MKLLDSAIESGPSYPTDTRQAMPENLYFDLDRAPQPLSDEQIAVFERAGDELEQHHQAELRSGLTGRRMVEYHILNDTAETERDCLFMTGWGQSVVDPSTAQAVRYLAAVHPQTRWIIPTTPGLNGTDRLPQSILRGLRKGGSFVAAGDYMLEAMRSVRRPLTPLDIYTYSQGSSFGVGMGAASDKGEIRNIRTIDPAALQHRGLVGMFVASQISNAHAKATVSPLDEICRPRTVQTDRLSKRRPVSRNEIGTLVDMYLRYPLAMGRAAFWSDAEQALSKISGDITTIIGERSEYNKLAKVQAALARGSLVSTGLMRIGTFNGFHSSIVSRTRSLADLAAETVTV